MRRYTTNDAKVLPLTDIPESLWETFRDTPAAPHYRVVKPRQMKEDLGSPDGAEVPLADVVETSLSISIVANAADIDQIFA